MITDTVRHAFRQIWWSLVIRGILALALGVLILARPFDSIAAFALVIAMWALVSGITEVVHAIELKPFFSRWWIVLFAGLVSIAFGVAAFYYYPGLSLAFAITWVSLWLAFSGILGIAVAIEQKRSELPWGWTLAWGILSVGASMIAWLSPPTTLAAIMGLISGFAIVSGIALLVGAMRLRSLERTVKQVVGHPSTA